VSLDGDGAAAHDLFRRTPGLFDLGVDGLRAARELGILTRVNTVVGPHNYTQMPALQRRLEDIGVQQWELSGIKLERTVRYADPADVLATCEPLFRTDRPGALVPLGSRFYGDTPSEQEAYFSGVRTPRPLGDRCLVTQDVIYLDPKTSRAFACSCLPHRDPGEGGSGAARDDSGRILLDSPTFYRHRTRFEEEGPRMCSGCSTTAAGYSDDLARLGDVPAWHY
jgi:cytosylglucuronate decarboxylase